MTKKKLKTDAERARKGIFLLIAFAILLFLDLVVFGGQRPYLSIFKADEAAHKSTATIAPVEGKSYTPPSYKRPTIDNSAESGLSLAIPILNIPVHAINLPKSKKLPVWQANAVPVDVPQDWPKVVIIIDDMGVDVKRSAEMIDMKWPLTLSFLPYARNVAKQAKEGRKHGHELMVHMPMEPMNPNLDTGPIVLKEAENKKEFINMLDKGLSAFDGYVGLNNHMGSRLTQDKDAMALLMDNLERRGLLFVDSRTIATSVAADTATSYGIPHATRDVFIDHESSLDYARQSLAKLERVARKNGVAIAIGHPRDNTIAALKEWLPTLKDKKIAIVPVSAVVGPHGHVNSSLAYSGWPSQPRE